MPKKKITKKLVKKPRQTGKKEEFAYTITDTNFSDFKVLNTSNAWWLDKTKVVSLINAFKIDATIKQACAYAGITLRQYQYFLENHKDFCYVKETCTELPMLKAKATLVKDLKTPSGARFYATTKGKDEFSTKTEVIQGTPKQFSQDAKEKANKAIRSFRRGDSKRRN